MSIRTSATVTLLLPCVLFACDASLTPSADSALIAPADAPLTAADERRVSRDASADDDFNVPGTTVHRLTVGGLEREAIVYVPRRARGTTPVPVVFMLHGTSGDGERFYRISGWREKADEVGFIAVFPSALHHCFFEDENRDGDFDDRGEMKLTTKWASGIPGDPVLSPPCDDEDLARLTSERRALVDHPFADDVAFFEAMLDLLEDEYAVDSRRVYASGFSNGAAMVSRLAFELSDRFAAVAAAAGTLQLEPAPSERPVPMVFTLGSKDDRFTEPYGVTEFDVSEDFLADYPGVAARIVGEYLTLCGLDPAHTYTERTAGAYLTGDFTFTTPLEGAPANELHFVVLEGLGHQYPNGKNYPLRLANPLWDFFRTRRLP